MYRLRQILTVTGINFRQWKNNPRIYITFSLAFILCFLLSDKAVRFAEEYNTTMQLVEAFVWTFGDTNSILLSSLLLVLLFADMPFISAGTPFFLMRINRRIWLAGQAVYIICATLLYLVFVLVATSLVSMHNSFIGNLWSETAAILGYSGTGAVLHLPALVKTMEISTPYSCMAAIFLLMLMYTLIMVFIMLLFNIRKGQMSGVISVFAFSLFGFLLNPQLFKQLLHLKKGQLFVANIMVGWLSPLNQATYSMHNFGFDSLPKLWQSFLIFGILLILLFLLALRAIKKYNFNFSGTEG